MVGTQFEKPALELGTRGHTKQLRLEARKPPPPIVRARAEKRLWAATRNVPVRSNRGVGETVPSVQGSIWMDGSVEIEATPSCQPGPNRQIIPETPNIPSSPDDFHDLSGQKVEVLGDIRSKVDLKSLPW